MDAEPKLVTEHIGSCAGDPDRVRFIIKWKVWEYRAEARVYEATYSASAGEPMALDEVQDLESWDLDADLRWDGCANWNFSPQGIMLHTCTLSDVQDFAAVMVHIRKRAEELIPTFDGA